MQHAIIANEGKYYNGEKWSSSKSRAKVFSSIKKAERKIKELGKGRVIRVSIQNKKDLLPKKAFILLVEHVDTEATSIAVSFDREVAITTARKIIDRDKARYPNIGWKQTKFHGDLEWRNKLHSRMLVMEKEVMLAK